MSVIARPASLQDAFDALDALPNADLLAGGTDFMVEVNFGHRRPPAVVAVRRVPELQGYQVRPDEVDIGAAVTWTTIEGELADELPALAAAARTVGSPQMRNAATIGGNIATASPAGDGLPVLLAADASLVLASRHGERTMPIADFITGVKRTILQPGEIITRVLVPRLTGPQEFLKVGTRNAMVISVVMAALVVDLDGRTVRLGLGSVAPVPVRAREAEAYVEAQVDWDAADGSARIGDAAVFERFGELAATATAPIDDHRSTAAYRRHAVAVCARRALERAMQ